MSEMRKVKSWVLTKAPQVLGIRRLQEQLEQTNELLRSLIASPSAREAAASTEQPSRVCSLEALRRLAHDGLFVLGCARSGTTILTRCLNRAPEIMLLEEPSFFLHEDVADFVSFFNGLHASMGNRCLKGTFVPPPIADEIGPLDLLCRLRQDYRYVGEKVAVGPHDYPADWCQTYLQFQGKYFLHSRYIFIIRAPVEVLWSMHKMFGDRPIARLLETWLRATALSLDACQFFPNSRVVFFQDLAPPMVDKLADWLELAIDLTPGTLGSSYIHSALEAGSIPRPLLPFETFCTECTEIYQELRASFSKDEFVYRGTINQWRFLDSILKRIEKLIQTLSPPEGAEERPSRS